MTYEITLKVCAIHTPSHDSLIIIQGGKQWHVKRLKEAGLHMDGRVRVTCPYFGRTDLSLPIFDGACLHYLWSEVIFFWCVLPKAMWGLTHNPRLGKFASANMKICVRWGRSTKWQSSVRSKLLITYRDIACNSPSSLPSVTVTVTEKERERGEEMNVFNKGFLVLLLFKNKEHSLYYSIIKKKHF